MHSIFKDFRGYALVTDYDGNAWIAHMNPVCGFHHVYEFPFPIIAIYSDEDLSGQLETAHHAVLEHRNAH